MHPVYIYTPKEGVIFYVKYIYIPEVSNETYIDFYYVLYYNND